MYLKPVATGAYDWVSISDSVRRECVITRGLSDLNADPVPGRMRFAVNDVSGDFNRRNPVGLYFGSIGLGTPTRASLVRVEDVFSRTETTSWGAVGNEAGDTWTNGTSSGGTVTNTDWAVTSGTARHSLPVDNAVRVSELSAVDRLFVDSEVRAQITCPVNNVTGTGAISSEVRFRCLDQDNYVAAVLQFNTDETTRLGVYEQIAGVDRTLAAYTAISGLSTLSVTVYKFAAQVEGSAVRLKVWDATEEEPQDWQVTTQGATIRAGYTSIASLVATGNLNTKPLVVQYDNLVARIPLFTGEVTELTPAGDGMTEPKTTAIEIADVLERVQSGSTPTKSVMRRGRAAKNRWFYIATLTATSGSVNTFTLPTASVSGVQTGDFFSLSTSTGPRKEDAVFTITGSSTAGANTTFTFTPDARDSVAAGNLIVAYRTSSPASLPVAYWPCEDGDQATQISSGLPFGSPMAISGATPDFGAETGFPCSAPILKINDAELVATIPEYVDTNQSFTITFLLAMPDSDEAATGSDLVQFYSTGTGYSWDLRYTANGNGSLQLLVFNSAFTQLFDSGQIDFSLRGDRCQITLYVEQVGGTVTYSLYKTGLTGTIGGTGPNTVTGVSVLGKCTQIRINPAGGYNDVVFGHLAVIPDVWDANMTYYDVRAWSGQSALLRFLRLCEEESIPSSYQVDWDVVTATLGPQKIDRMVNLLKQPVQTDGGFLYGPKGAIGLELRSRGSLTNQSALATFSATDGEILPPFDPVIDYAETYNYVEVTRIDGTTAIAENTDGPLSTELPPNGIGQRDESYTLSIGSDDLVQDHADWRLGLGTVDEYRVPRFTVTPAGADSLGVELLMSLNIGSRVDIVDLTDKHIYDDLPQVVLGYNLNISDKFYPVLEMNVAPYELFRTLALTTDDHSRVDGYDSFVDDPMTTTDTSMAVTSSSDNYPWTTLASDLPFYVEVTGEVMEVTAVNPSGSPQVFTVVRSVNGVVKSHGLGEDVVLADPNYWQFR